MCCGNYNTNIAKLFSKAIMDENFRERLLANPVGTAQEFGFSQTELNQLAKYDARKLRAIVEGPRPRSCDALGSSVVSSRKLRH
jgi:hypothetical protein